MQYKIVTKIYFIYQHYFISLHCIFSGIYPNPDGN